MTVFEKIKDKLTIQNIINIIVLGISIYLLIYHFQVKDDRVRINQLDVDKVKKVINLIDVKDDSIRINKLDVDDVNYKKLYPTDSQGYIWGKYIQISEKTPDGEPNLISWMTPDNIKSNTITYNKIINE